MSTRRERELDLQRPETHMAIGLECISPSGADVFFQTFDRLVPKDTDSQEDTYDARVDGGFAEPPPPPACQADACQGSLSGAPVLLSPGSEFQAGGENVTPRTGATPAAAKKATKAKAKRRRKRRRGAGPRRRGPREGGAGRQAAAVSVA